MATSKTDAIRPFSFRAPDEELVDLRRRIIATRYPDRETVADDSQGVQLATIQKLARYWVTEYDWRKVEARLSSFPSRKRRPRIAARPVEEPHPQTLQGRDAGNPICDDFATVLWEFTSVLWRDAAW